MRLRIRRILILVNPLFKDINFAITDYKHAGIRPVYNYSPKSAEERSAEKLAEKLHLDSVYKNHQMFLQTKGIPVDSVWNLNIKEEGRSERYEKRIHITEYSSKALQQNNGNLIVHIAELMGNEILCDNNLHAPELSNLYLFSFWFNRLLLGIVIGLIMPLKDVRLALLRGVILGLIISFGFYSATDYNDLLGFLVGAVYGAVIEFIAFKIK